MTDVTVRGRREITSGKETRYWEILLTLEDLPSDRHYRDWHSRVSRAFFQGRKELYWRSMRLDSLGIVTCQVPEGTEWNPKHLINYVEQVLADEKRAVAAARERNRAEEEERQRVIAAFEAEVEANKAEIPTWINKIVKLPRQSEWSIQIDPVDGVHHIVVEELKAAGLPLQPPGARIVLVGDRSFHEVLGHLRSIDETVKARSAHEDEQARDFRANTKALEGSIRAELTRRGNRASD